jgi:hypothetical protein
MSEEMTAGAQACHGQREQWVQNQFNWSTKVVEHNEGENK